MGNITQLQEVGQKPQNALFESMEWGVRDSIIIAPEKELVNTVLFTSDNKDEMYKTPGFPSTSQAHIIKALSATLDLQFTTAGSKAAEQIAYLNHFINGSYLEIRKEGHDVARICLRDLVNFEIIPNPAELTATSPKLKIREKMNNQFPLKQFVEIGAGSFVTFEFKPAKSLKTAAKDATNYTTPYHPNANLTDNVGFVVTFDLIVSKIKQA